MAVVKSRCGVDCSECEIFHVECKGCVDSLFVFKGKCEVKHCCESQNIEHCGKCKSFPCENLEYLSYDPDNGDNGVRIRNCAKWGKEGE